MTERKLGTERFVTDSGLMDFDLRDFWAWSGSQLAGNVYRGWLAEYIVGRALGALPEMRLEWAPYDLEFKGKAIEVRSSAYIQTWPQIRHSRPTFGIAPSYPDTATADSPAGTPASRARRADVYVFALLKHQDLSTLNPLNVDQWAFYVVPTAVLNERHPTQQQIGLAGLRALAPLEVGYAALKRSVEGALQEKGSEL